MSGSKRMALVTLLLGTHLGLFLLGHREDGSGIAENAADGISTISAGHAGKAETRTAGERTQHARLWQKLLEADLSREDFEKSRSKLLKDWAQKDLPAVLELIYSPQAPATMCRFFPTNDYDEFIAKQPHEVLAWIRDGAFGSNRGLMYGVWQRAMLKSGQSELILASLDAATPAERREAVGSLAYEGSPADLRAVRAELANWSPGDPNYERTVIEYARRTATWAGDDAAALFKDEKDEGFRAELAKAWFQNRVNFPPRVDRLVRLLELPEDVREAAAAEVIPDFRRSGVEGVSETLAELERHGMWSVLAGEGCQRLVAAILAQPPSASRDGLLPALAAVSDAGARGKLLEAAGRGIAGAEGAGDPFSRLESLPQGAERDACLAGMVSALWKKNPDAARQGWENIGNEALRQRLLREMPKLAE
ncbi:hypothetical protein [Haloferula sp. BvORR071]|uniref:hypothetical protein n=1 Tax=Haloferula sp. BvORR071 TaxID=1396141 RepID=UPI000555C780|nr:hypothetical protein [Haloferula sp. BvORR071]